MAKCGATRFFGHLVDALEGFDKFAGWSVTFRDGRRARGGAPAAGGRRQAAVAPADGVEEFTYLRGRTKSHVKVTLISAQQAAAYYDPDKSKGAYATRDAYLADLVDFTRREIAELRRLGCEYVQIDAPQYAALLDEKFREGYRQRGSDPDRHARGMHRAGQRHHQRPLGVTFGIHICRGNHKSMFYASGGYERIAQTIFRRPVFTAFCSNTTTTGRARSSR
jgi:5-methyltetrahydropteroyltriglutamate--homocysteine methyltransferase